MKARSRLVGLIVAGVIALGLSTSPLNALECFTQPSSHSVFEEPYGWYCMGDGNGCTVCWDDIIVKG